MSYYLSVVVDGLGDDPKNRSHWAFALHASNASIGTILQVLVLNLDRLVYGFDKRKGVDVQSTSSEGYLTIANLSLEQKYQANEIISQQSAPRNGKDRRQDWVQNYVIALEVEEIIEAGTSEWLLDLVGQPASTVKSKAGIRWVSTVS
jgi:hypothetical protein